MTRRQHRRSLSGSKGGAVPEPTSQLAPAAGDPGAADGSLTERLATRITPDTNERLRLYVAMRRLRLGATVDQLCSKGLPTLAQLTDELAARHGRRVRNDDA